MGLPGLRHITGVECRELWELGSSRGERQRLLLSLSLGREWTLGTGLAALSVFSSPAEGNPGCSGLACSLHLEPALDQ